jgi:hypothetical protein
MFYLPELPSKTESRKQELWDNNNISQYSSILNTYRDPSRTSDRYAETNDLGVIEKMNANGWFITEYNELQVRDQRRQGFQKYCATYENNDVAFRTKEGKARIIQIGSHDGTAKLGFYAGFFRWACANGLMPGISIFEPYLIKHTGDAALEVDPVVEHFIESCPAIFNRIGEMEERFLTPMEKLEFELQAIALRFGDVKKVDPTRISQVRRPADEGDSLWKIFNRIQENVMDPPENLKIVSEEGKERKAKKITQIDTKVQLNKDLWTVADSFLLAA